MCACVSIHFSLLCFGAANFRRPRASTDGQFGRNLLVPKLATDTSQPTIATNQSSHAQIGSILFGRCMTNEAEQEHCGRIVWPLSCRRGLIRTLGARPLCCRSFVCLSLYLSACLTLSQAKDSNKAACFRFALLTWGDRMSDWRVAETR